MSDPVVEAAQALTPLLAAGADGALAETARQVGAEGAKAVRRVLGAARKALARDGAEQIDEQAVIAALRSALDEGAVTDDDLRTAVKVAGAGRDNYGIQVEGNAYIGSPIVVKGDFKG